MSNYLFKHPVTPLNNVNGDFVNVDGSNWAGRFGSTETSRQFALPDNFSDKAAAANASRISMMGGGRSRKNKHYLRKKIKNIVNKYRMSSKKMRKHTKRRLLSLYKRKQLNCKSRKYNLKGGNTGNTVLYGPIVSSQNMKLENGTDVYNSNYSQYPVDSVVNPYSINDVTMPMPRMLGGRRRNRSKSRSKMQRGGYNQYQSNIPMTQTYSRGGILSASELGLANPAPYQVLPNCTNCVDNYNYNTNSGFQI